uniref:Ycf21 n=1 Tax=Pterothamnion crispum TaxID=1550583 RepID=A0A4D6WWS7_9FLOR|nr:hypothetical protein [Pterothamnion crispum]
MNLYPLYEFHPILTLNNNQLIHLKTKLHVLVPIEWQFILVSDGSFTQNLHALIDKQPDIKMYQKYRKKSKNIIKNMRAIWLKNHKDNKFIFARSSWYLNNIDQKYINIINKQPVGKYLIESEIDMYKDIQEIYYGYCYNLEQKFQSQQPIWGRKYTIYYKHKSYATIQEYFSPKLLDLFRAENINIINIANV